MRTRLMALASAAFVALASFVLPATAAPVTAVSQMADAVAADTTLVQYRRHYARPAYRPYARYGYRPFVGFGVGAAIVAGAIIANRTYAPRRGYYYDTYAYDGPYYYPSDYRGDPREICARHFRSFEWRTGLYTTYQGEKRMCPYLGM